MSGALAQQWALHTTTEVLLVPWPQVRVSAWFWGAWQPCTPSLPISLAHTHRLCVTIVLHAAPQDILTPDELHYLHQASHRPDAVSQALSEAVVALSDSEYKVVAINVRISQYNDSVAACERLYKQPIPIAYTRYQEQHPCQCNLAHLPRPS